MALALGDVIQLSLRGSLFNQRVLNVLHYSVSVIGTGTDYDQLSIFTSNWVTNAFAINIRGDFLACLAPEYTLEEVRAQRVYPTRTVFAFTTDGGAGTYATGTEDSNISATMEKRTLTAGRMGIGSIHLAGVPTAVRNNGELTAGYLTGELAQLALDMKETLTTSGPVVTFAPCLYNPTAAGAKFSPLFNIIPMSSIRVMRRRTLRVGE